MIFRPACRFVTSINLLALTFGLSLTLSAAEKKEARVTQVIQDVQLVGIDAAVRMAAVNDSVSEGTNVRTGADSRVELTFSDKTVTRLGANAVFEFRDGTRNSNTALAPSRVTVLSLNVSSTRESAPVRTLVPSETLSFTAAIRTAASIPTNCTSCIT